MALNPKQLIVPGAAALTTALLWKLLRPKSGVGSTLAAALAGGLGGHMIPKYFSDSVPATDSPAASTGTPLKSGTAATLARMGYDPESISFEELQKLRERGKRIQDAANAPITLKDGEPITSVQGIVNRLYPIWEAGHRFKDNTIIPALMSPVVSVGVPTAMEASWYAPMGVATLRGALQGAGSATGWARAGAMAAGGAKGALGFATKGNPWFALAGGYLGNVDPELAEGLTNVRDRYRYRQQHPVLGAIKDLGIDVKDAVVNPAGVGAGIGGGARSIMDKITDARYGNEAATQKELGSPISDVDVVLARMKRDRSLGTLTPERQDYYRRKLGL